MSKKVSEMNNNEKQAMYLETVEDTFTVPEVPSGTEVLVRNINKKTYLLYVTETVKPGTSYSYYKVKEVEAFEFGKKLGKKFVVSQMKYYGEYGSVREGVIDKFQS